MATMLMLMMTMVMVMLMAIKGILHSSNQNDLALYREAEAIFGIPSITITSYLARKQFVHCDVCNVYRELGHQVRFRIIDVSILIWFSLSGVLCEAR